MECLHLTEFFKIAHIETEQTNSIWRICNLLKENKIGDTFPNVRS